MRQDRRVSERSDLLRVIDHPAVSHRLAELRDVATSRDRFRALAAELAAFLAYETLFDLGTTEVTVTTPMGTARGVAVAETPLVVPILRAGLGMVPGVLSVVPNAEVAHLGMRRNEQTLDAVTYLDGLPRDLSGRRVIVCDPMLATGGSLSKGCSLVAERSPAKVVALCLVASEPGLARFHAEHPEIPVTCAVVDPRLDERGFIVPGLGDAGDRLFGPPGG